MITAGGTRDFWVIAGEAGWLVFRIPGIAPTWHCRFHWKMKPSQRPVIMSVTSWARGGERVHHILSPLTGRPTAGLQSVSVIGPVATSTDALSTTLFVMGVVKGLALINRTPGYEAIMIDQHHKVHYSDGLSEPAQFKNSRELANLVFGRCLLKWIKCILLFQFPVWVYELLAGRCPFLVLMFGCASLHADVRIVYPSLSRRRISDPAILLSCWKRLFLSPRINLVNLT